MPSTWTENYGLELISTGEQQGTWGITTNQTYKRLEQMFGGSVTINLKDATTIPDNSTLSGAPIFTTFDWITTKTALAGEDNSEGRNPVVTFTSPGTDYSASGMTVNIQGTVSGDSPDRLFIVVNSLDNDADLKLVSNSGSAYTLRNGLSAFVSTDGTAQTVTNVLDNIQLSSVDFGEDTTGEIVLNASNTAALTIKGSDDVAFQTFNTTDNKIVLEQDTETASGKDLATTGTGTITSDGLLTASNGLTVTAGGIALDGGNLVVNPGGVTVTAGDVTVTTGNVIVNAGGLQLKEGVDISPESAAHGVLYTKDVNDTTELFFDNSTGGEVQLTPGFLTGVRSPVTTGSVITPVVIGQRFFDKNNIGWWTAFGTSAGEWVADIAPGTIWIFAGATAPEGWLLCDGEEPGDGADGTALEDLYGAIGNIYGGGGASDFKVPDIEGRTVAGRESSVLRLTTLISGIDGRALGAVGGDQRLQGHTHQFTSYVSGGGDSPGVGIGPATTAQTTSDHNKPIGGSGNVQPTIILNYMIKV